ncbi:MAG: SDR family oxidoreductase [candidate division Zixibacteria bacterium]|jgi:short-subunit dehydrogenase|nr:SDR family oxidoreductase [candidate division Zixibacteria bacterium]
MPAETVLITGASSGIGMELARVFAAEGSNLVLAARREKRIAALAEQFRDEFVIDTVAIPADLSEPDTPQILLEKTQALGIEIDVLVNNAGFGQAGRFDRIDVNRHLDMIAVNIAALTHLTRLFLPGMVRRDRGGVLNVASTAAFVPGPLVAVYYASKAYVLSFTEALAEELAETSVTVSCLCPGPTKTEFAEIAGLDTSTLFRLGMADARKVAEAGVRGFRNRQVVILPGIRNKLTPPAIRVSPRSMVRKIVKKLQG